MCVPICVLNVRIKCAFPIRVYETHDTSLNGGNGSNSGNGSSNGSDSVMVVIV